MSDETPVWDEQSDPLEADSSSGASSASATPPKIEPTEGLFSRIRWGLISFILLSVAVIILAAQNTQSVRVRALTWEAEAPLVVIILITVLVSVVLDELVGVIIRRRRRRRMAEREELRRLRSQQHDT